MYSWMHLDISVSTHANKSPANCVWWGGQSKGCTGTWERPSNCSVCFQFSHHFTQQSDHFLQYEWSEDMPEFENLQQPLNTLRKKDLISFSAEPVSSNDLAIIHFSPALSHIGPSSVLFRMVFPWWSSFLSFNSQTKHHCFRETLFDPLNLKLHTLISSHCPHQYLSHPAALGRVCHNF